MWIKKNDYHMTNGNYTIAKYFIRDVAKYGLWRDNVNLGYYNSFDDAKNEYERLSK